MLLTRFILLQIITSSLFTFTVSDNMNSHYSEIEAFYNKYLKYAIGITKYASNTITLGELGRFPIQIKATVSAILYWLRLTHGTENILLNAAFSDYEKWQKYMVTKCTIYILDKWHRECLAQPWKKGKKSIKTYPNAQDMFIQQYRAYLNDEASTNKCLLAKMCDKGVYNMSHYLSNVKSLQIRSIIAKYRD